MDGDRGRSNRLKAVDDLGGLGRTADNLDNSADVARASDATDGASVAASAAADPSDAIFHVCDCLPHGTPVEIPTGAVPIEQLRVGDRVIACNLYQRLLESIEKPVSDEEARALLRLFGLDDCFGLAWALVHLVESAPGWPLDEVEHFSDNEWLQLLRGRAERGAKS